jgi:hypothetical protein
MNARSALRGIPLILAAAVSQEAMAAAFQFSTGVEYSSGDYGEVAITRALSVPFAARMSFGNFSIRASIPYVTVRGPADITVVVEDDGGSNSGSGSSGSGSGSGSGSSGGGSGSGSSGSGSSGSGSDGAQVFATDRDVRGFGDTSFALAYSFVDIAASRLYVDVTGRVRLPTGKESVGLGNGTTDYAALTEVGWDGRKGGVYVGGGRRFLGDRATVARVDGWQGNAGFWRRLGPLSSVGMQGNWRDASVVGSPDPKSVDFYLNRKLSNSWRMEVSGGAGLSDANADYVVGLTFSWRTTGRR